MKKKFLKQAGVLLLIALFFMGSGAMGVNTLTNSQTNEKKEIYPGNAPMGHEIVWDNIVGVHGMYGGFIATQTGIPHYAAFVADDFKLDIGREVDSIFWQGAYGQCQLAEGQKDYDWDWRVIFWNDSGTGVKPGSEIYNKTIPTAEITREFWYTYTNPLNNGSFWVANYSATLPEPIIFDVNTTYWITVQAVRESEYPYSYWIRHNISVGGVKLHEAVFKGRDFGSTGWQNLKTFVYEKLECDVNYQLFGPELPIEITIKGGFGVSAEIKNIGTTDLTNINWNIALNGEKISLGKTKSGVIPSIPVGGSVTVKDFVFGFGNTGIIVKAGPVSVGATGSAFLFFISGIT